jgi:hypothetical protein
MRRFVLLSVVALSSIMVSCRPETVALAYQFPEGSSLNYEMVSSVTAEWDFGSQDEETEEATASSGEGSYEVVFDVTEEVQSVEEDGAIVALNLRRTSVEEDNLTPPSDSSFTVKVNEFGSVTEVIEVDGVSANLLEPEQKSVIRTYRPLLAIEPVRLYQEWPGSQEFQGPEFEQLSLVGRLEKLDRDDKGDFAELSYSGEGPLIGAFELPEGDAELSGAAETTGEAIIDLDNGLLRTASSITRYEYEATVVPLAAGTPLTGPLTVEQELELTRVEGEDS